MLAPFITRDLGLGLGDLGLVFSAFYWTYALMQLPVALVIRRLGARRAYALAVTCWSLAAAAGGAVTGLASLFVLRALLGLFEAANWPCAMTVVGGNFPRISAAP